MPRSSGAILQPCHALLFTRSGKQHRRPERGLSFFDAGSSSHCPDGCKASARPGPEPDGPGQGRTYALLKGLQIRRTGKRHIVLLHRIILYRVAIILPDLFECPPFERVWSGSVQLFCSCVIGDLPGDAEGK